jgi:zinc protease
VQDSVTLSEQLNLNRFDPDYYPLQLGNHVLGGGFYATRLYHDLRQVAGYVYTVDVSLRASESRAAYSVLYGCNPENVSKARALIQRDLEQMRTQDVSSAELQQAKALLLRQIPLEESSEQSVAGGILGRALIGLPLDEPIQAAKRYAELNAEQVKAAFAKYLRPGDFVQVVRGPAPR